MIADIALAHGAALGERHCRRFAAVVGGKLHRQVNHAHLRAIAVAHHDVVAFFHKVYNCAGSLFYKLQLFLGGIA